MKIKIEKKKAIKREGIQRACWLFLGTIILYFNSILIFYFMRYILDFTSTVSFSWKPLWILFSFIIMSVYEFVRYKLFVIKLKSLEYEFVEKENRLIKSWKLITKHKDTARLQIVNSVDINQDIWDRFADTYSLSVCYGFSGEGYNYRFSFLSEEEAEKLLPLIKSSSSLGVELK